MPETFGLSRATVSRRFIRASAAQLKALKERNLQGEDFVAVVLDGKSVADEAVVLALGITLGGEKRLLGLVQTAIENTRVLTEFLQGLLARGLRPDAGLWLVDGGRGLRGPRSAQWPARMRPSSAASGTSARTW